jgi:serine/threonine-protein kinase ULK/ATG1
MLRLYMAPEILRYEKYDAKVDLWSVGAVLFEMAVGKPPFRANNHVELLRKIEKGEDRIKFPDESSRQPDPNVIPPLPVPLDIKTLIRALLKRHSIQRMSFDAFFGSSQIWEGYMYESRSTVEGSLDLDVSSESSEAETNTGRLQEMVDSVDRERAQAPLPTHAPQPISTQPALNPQPARARSDLEEKRAEYTPRATPAPLPVTTVPTPPTVPAQPADHSHLPPFARPPPVRRSEPKYYVQDDRPSNTEPPVTAPSPSENTTRPRPIQTPSQRPHRRFSSREPGSVEEAQPITPGSNHPPSLPRSRTIGEGSPLAATPPITMNTGKDESALEADDSMVAKEYVVIDKGTVQVNALADGQ